MKISIKTLKGELFQVEVQETDQISAVKAQIQASREDMVSTRQKLIHAGKVLKDDQSIADLGISESDFIVCMLTKEPKKTAAPTAAPNVAPAAAPAPATATSTDGTTTTQAESSAGGTTSTTDAASSTPSTAAPAPVASPFATTEGVQALVNMGFPEGESRAALTAAMGNPDLAYEFLLTGIPEQARAASAATAASPATTAAPVTPATTGAAAGQPVTIELLRRHPQFNMLKQLVQNNPAALSQVLDVIGQQNPDLLAAIHENNDAFIAMMNEPIVDTPPPAPAAAAAATAPVPPTPLGAGANPAIDPSQFVATMRAMPAAQRDQFAQQMGMSPDQLEGFMTMMASMPPEQMASILRNAGMSGVPGGGPGGADPPGVIRLTEEEMESVNRLVALGFSQQQAAQAYLACDKNETLAANLLFEGGWDDEGDVGGAGGAFGGGGGGGDDDDNMYN